MERRVEKCYSSGLQMTAAWTYSKFMEATGFLNATDPAPTPSISDQDRTHRIVTSSIYELPIGRRKRLASSWRGLAGKILEGWQLQSIYQWHTRPPLAFAHIPSNA